MSIKCWDCRSDADPKCADPFDNSTLSITDCKQQPELEHLPGVRPTMCRKIRQKGKLCTDLLYILLLFVLCSVKDLWNNPMCLQWMAFGVTFVAVHIWANRVLLAMNDFVWWELEHLIFSWNIVNATVKTAVTQVVSQRPAKPQLVRSFYWYRCGFYSVKHIKHTERIWDAQ